VNRLLVANRGEIAIRLLRGASARGLGSVAVYSEDDDRSLHVRRADEALPLTGVGPAAYLDGEKILELAQQAGCDAIHPGYGFLAENAEFARSCAEANAVFVGPGAATLERLGDKLQALALAEQCEVPVLRGTRGATSLDEARSFLGSLGSGGVLLVKALHGGGGRGMRAVESPDALDEAYERATSEAEAAFGSAEVYVERFLPHARHIEVQVLGDGTGAVVAPGERECTLQRRHQKLVEIAPSPSITSTLRQELIASALRMANEIRYESLGTFEFLVEADGSFAFIEANPRLQVEHTVTEAVLGLDLVELQLAVASGATLSDLGLGPDYLAKPRGYAVQARVNLEKMGAGGEARPSGGTLVGFEPPSGPGVRVDTYGYAGYTTNPRFDSLLAKVVAHSSSDQFPDAVALCVRALREFRIEGVDTNRDFLCALLSRPEVTEGGVHTRFVEEEAESLLEAASATPRSFEPMQAEPTAPVAPAAATGARLDSDDPLAVLEHGKQEVPLEEPPPAEELPEGSVVLEAPLQGTIVSVDVALDDAVAQGQPVLVLEAMKMEHVIAASTGGVVEQICVAAGDTVLEGHALVRLRAEDVAAAAEGEIESIDLDSIRPDLAEVHERHAIGLDAARPAAVDKRHERGQRTARENIEALCDPDSFVEYGPLVIAAQRRRRSLEDLIENTPGDGLVMGIGRVNGDRFEDDAARCIAMSYDYMVLAGTQGGQNHRKKDRMFELAEKHRLPIVLFAEGGGGRPGDTDGTSISGLDCLAFRYFGQLSGLVPLVGITSGRCFAGNAALLGCCDVVIATKGSNIGMGGPAMIEGGGLGIFRPEEVGPLEEQRRNGVVDIAVEDEGEAAAVARKYLSYFQGATPPGQHADPRKLRHLIPENRLRIYDVREVIETLADTGSVLELRRDFGLGMVTALARIEGRPMGIIANNPSHLAGAIDSDGADKAARFMQLCDAHDLPLLMLCDTPGIMVGPESERSGTVRHASRMFVVGASLTVPMFSVILRKGYGLGAQAMAGGSFKSPFFTVAWPTGEFGGMGLEGAAKLGFRKELEAIEDGEERKAAFEKIVAGMYERGKAVNHASAFEIDDVIDPKDTRHWITSALRSIPAPPPRSGKKRPCIDAW
jgi:acetyl/propionyl-CoA carboxylase alpha subunit